MRKQRFFQLYSPASGYIASSYIRLPPRYISLRAIKGEYNITFANGYVEEYTYDVLDRLVSVKYNNVVTYTLTYNSNCALAKCVDNKSGITHEYVYDGLGRLIRAWQKDTSTGEKVLAVTNEYDEFSRPYYSSASTARKYLDYSIYYNANGLVNYLNMPAANILSTLVYNYDSFDRVTGKTISFSNFNNISEEYEYYVYTSGGVSHTTGLISSLKLKRGNTATATYSYLYDAVGNITRISKNGVAQYEYEYDSLGQLVREYNYPTGVSQVFTYDKSGNITHKYKVSGYGYNCPAGHILATIPYGQISEETYGYNDSQWGDLLTNYCGTSITYDFIGNPLKWRNASSFTWNGRQLTNVDLSAGSSASYAYNAEGIRTSKTFGGTTHQYVLDGTRIISETVSGNENYTLYYLYDENGSPVGLIHDDNAYNYRYYYYQKNIQGDVIRICNDQGETIVEYTYDAWGKLLSTTGSASNTIGRINPIRYRGYYYDTETGFYYLNNRYYDPEVGRFLNADIYVSTGQGILGYNMFAYCNNNPVINKDIAGLLPVSIESIGDWISDVAETVATWGNENIVQPIGTFVNNIVEDFKNFDFDNTDEQKVIDANYFSVYKKKAAIKLGIGGNAFSFATLFIGNDVKDPNTIKHEYGHSIHLDEIGPINYLYTVAIPSLYGYWTNVPSDQYYSQPWEYTADVYGGVTNRLDSSGQNYQYKVFYPDWIIYKTISRHFPVIFP